jgi:hypothetical protein
MGKKQVWDKMDGETSKAFHAFCLYVQTPTATRSIKRVSETLGLKTDWNVGKWSRKNDWVQRAAQYDEYRESLRRAAEEKADIEYFEAERKKHRKNQMVVGQGMYAVGASALAHLKDRAYALTAHEVAKLIETGAGQVSRALGDPDIVAESRGVAQPVALVSPEFSQFLMDWAKKPNEGEK